jgi:hypothetical protein
MSNASRNFADLPPAVKRLLLALGGVTFFLGVAMIVNPERSMASGERARFDPARLNDSPFAPQTPTQQTAMAQAQPTQQPTTIQGATSLQPTSQRPLLGTLVGSPYYIWVYAGPQGPLYTIADQSGKILATEVTAEQLYEQVPDASVEGLRLQTSGTNIMLADPAKQFPSGQ